MSGLILLLALIACGWAGFLLVRFVGRMVPSDKWRNPVTVGLTLLLLATPFVDEVIGMYQFKTLCKINGIEGADVSKARGKQVRKESGERLPLGGVIMPIKISKEIIRDANTGEILIQYNDYYAKGGWLMRYTPISMGDFTPMIFNGNGCGWNLKDQIFSKNKISQIN